MKDGVQRHTGDRAARYLAPLARGGALVLLLAGPAAVAAPWWRTPAASGSAARTASLRQGEGSQGEGGQGQGGGGVHGIPNAPQVPSDVIAADLNGDGLDDLVIAYAYDDRVAWYLANGDGTFTQGGSQPVGILAGVSNDLPRRLALADFDSDGLPDLAVVCSGLSLPAYTAPSLGILYGLPGGGFEAWKSVAIKPEDEDLRFATALAVGDLNGDGHPDLAVGFHDSNRLSVVLGLGDRRFGEPRIEDVTTSGGGPYGLRIADLDGDSAADLVVVNDADAQVWMGQGDGTFGERRELDKPGGSTARYTDAALGDFDGDGRWDVALPDYDSDRLRVLMGTGNTGGPLSFSRHDIALPTGAMAIGPAVYDADLDGIEDLALLYWGKAGGQLFFGKPGAGGGTPLRAGRQFATATRPWAARPWDANQDFWPDLAIVNEGDEGATGNSANDDVTIDLGAAARQDLVHLTPPVATDGGMGGLTRPVALAWDPARGGLWTVDRPRRRLALVSPRGTVERKIDLTQIGGGGVIDPVALAVGGDETIWLADRPRGRIVRIDGDGHALGEIDTAVLGIEAPSALAYDADDHLFYLTGDGAGEIVALTVQGTVDGRWSLDGGMPPIRGLGWDTAGGRLWAVLGRAAEPVVALKLKNGDDEHGGGDAKAEIDQPITLATDSGSFLRKVDWQSVAVDPDGTRCWVLGRRGLLAKIGLTAGRPALGLTELTAGASCAALAEEPGGTWLAADGGALGTIRRLSADGTALSTFTLATTLGRPVRVTGLARSADTIYVLEEAGVIDALTADGSLREEFGEGVLAGRSPRGLSWLAGRDRLVVGLAGRLLELAPPEVAGDGRVILSSVSDHPIAADMQADSLAAIPNGGVALFDATAGRLTLYDGAWKLDSVIPLPTVAAGDFRPRGAIPLNSTATVWQFYGDGAQPLRRAQLVLPPSGAGAAWRFYR